MLALLIIVVVALSSVSATSCGVDPKFPGFNPSVYTYQTSNSTVSASLSRVVPHVPKDLSIYLGSASCLGQVGPLGCYGPLGSLGPIGTNLWNPSYWISGTGMDWSNFSKTITGEGGPLSYAGPLGSSGPLGNAYYQVLPCMGEFAANLALSGLWTILGPLGPLGPLGALGPLGPIGAHGYKTNKNGEYVDHGKVVRSISVAWDHPTTRTNTYELYESYTQEFASAWGSNDCSFLVEGDYGSNGDSGDTYSFTSNDAQYVTILLVPLKQLDTFSITVQDAKGNVICHTGPDLYIDWVQIRVPPKTKLTVVVKLEYSFQPLNSDYRLYVTGSTKAFDATNFEGPHLAKYKPVH